MASVSARPTSAGHNGEMRADSVIHHGTIVTLTLPIRREEASDTQKEESEIVV